MKKVILLVVVMVVLLLSACMTGAEEDVPEDIQSAPQSDSHRLENPGGIAMSLSTDAPFDASYLDTMIAHHEQAVTMARMAADQAESAEVRSMAALMIENQQAEIDQMKTWREDWYPDLDHTLGLQIPRPDTRFIQRDETAFDREFLMAMIAHHAWAKQIAREALRRAEHDELREMAQDMIDAQSAEMDAMQQALDEE